MITFMLGKLVRIETRSEQKPERRRDWFFAISFLDIGKTPLTVHHRTLKAETAGIIRFGPHEIDSCGQSMNCNSMSQVRGNGVGATNSSKRGLTPL
jgi:hypothetical protein